MRVLPIVLLHYFGLTSVLLVAGCSGGGGNGDEYVESNDGENTLSVANGYGSGVYALGQTVHVWSAVSTTNQVALPWTDEASLLAEPDEWHSTLVMPAHDLELVANAQSQELTLTIELFNGSTSVPKTVRYYFPPAMRSVVIFSHGTGGSSNYIEGTEAFAIALALVQKGYGVLATDSEEAASGNAGPDGKSRWNMKFTADNVDLNNLQVLFADFETRGLISAGMPKFALGMSAGGSQSHFLGTIGASAVADDFPQLRFNAVVAYCADATASRSATLSTTPSAWFMCGAEDNPEVSNDEAYENHQTLSGRGIATDYIEHPPSPLFNERFTRIAGISTEASTLIAEELRAAGFVDDDGFINTDGDTISQLVIDNPGDFPTLLAQTGYLGSIRGQLKVMRAEHAMFADYTRRNINWFERFNPNE